MDMNKITHDNLPEAIEILLAKVIGLERRLDAAALPPLQPDYVTLQQAKDMLLGTVTHGTLYNWKSQGRISAIKVGRKLLFKRTDIEAILQKGFQADANQ